jgi:hypothetical protein
MKNLTIIICFLSFFTGNIKAQQYDICVYGATSAGVIAAYTAAKMGKSVLLIEPTRHIGGLTSGGLGYTDIGNKYAITGLARDFYRKMGRHYGKFEQWIFEPHVAENLFKEYLKSAKITTLFEYRLKNTVKQKRLINKILLEHSISPSISTDKTISAKIFIDCSYEGDLMARSGISYIVGRESNATHNEKYNGVQLMKGHQFPDGISPYKIPGDSLSGLLWGISNGKLQPNGTGDEKVQAYNYRICLTNDPLNRLPITRPLNYDSSKYELLVRLFEAQPEKKALNDYFILSKMPNYKTDINNRGGFSTDMIGMNHDYPEAGYVQRSRIIKDHEDYVKGLLYFYSYDRRVPKVLQEEMLQWGYPKDEYADYAHWSPQLYIRESRRMIGDYVMTQADCEGRTVISDGVGMAAYTMDSHNCQRLVVNGMVKNEGNVEIGGFGPYPISYRAIVPRQHECVNLFVPVCLSASHIAYGSIRMEPVFMVLAQSAATAASMAIDDGVTIQEVNIKKLQEQLQKNPLVDGSPPDVLVDNDDVKMVTINGKWKRITSEMELGYTGNYGPSMLVSMQTGERNISVKFNPLIQVDGMYNVYAYVPKIPGASSSMKITVFDGKRQKEVTINRAEITVEGQTSGEWISLGSYALTKGNKAHVIISGTNSIDPIVADAILFVYKK